MTQFSDMVKDFSEISETLKKAEQILEIFKLLNDIYIPVTGVAKKIANVYGSEWAYDSLDNLIKDDPKLTLKLLQELMKLKTFVGNAIFEYKTYKKK